jgi:hypothetical protein
MTPMLCVDENHSARFHETNTDGRPASRVVLTEVDHLAVSDDGTLLIAGNAVRMVARNGRTNRLAVAVTARTHATVTSGRVEIAATAPGRVTIRITAHGETQDTVRRTIDKGRTVVRLRHPAAPGERDIVLMARTANGRVAAHRFRTIVPGPNGLDVAAVRRMALRLTFTGGDPENCHGIPPAAATCTLVEAASQPGQPPYRQTWTIRRTPDGVFHATVIETGGAEPERRRSMIVQP